MALRVALATFVCAFIGSRLGAGIDLLFPGYRMAWVGGLIGCLIGWIAVGPREFASNVKRAWNEATNWQPNYRYWRRFWLVRKTNASLFWRAVLWVSCGSMSVFTSLASLIGLFNLEYIWQNICQVPSGGLFVGLMLWVVTGVTGIFIVRALPRKYRGSRVRNCYREDVNMWKSVAKYANPISAVYWTIYGLCLVGILIFENIPSRADIVADFHKTVAEFKQIGGKLIQVAKLTIIYTHDNLRTMVFVDTAVGYVLARVLGVHFEMGIGGELLGAAIGGAWAAFNYTVVARGWLKLDPIVSNPAPVQQQ